MHPSNLPHAAKVTVEKHTSTNHHHHPRGMLDRDQRTAFRIEKSTMNSSVPLSESIRHTKNNSNQPSSIHFNYYHQNQHQQSFNRHQIKDNNHQTDMCLSATTKHFRKSDFNRSRTKFSVTFHLIAWIVLFTISFTQSKAMPVPDDCVGIKNQTFYNNAQTELSIDYLDSNLRLYKLAINAPDTLFPEWDHKIRKLSTIDVKALFNDDAPVIEVFKKTLNNITEELFAITKAINYIILMHNNTNSMQQTKHYHNLSTEINGNVTLYFKNIFGYVRLNIDHIGDASRILNLKLFNPDVNEIGYEYAKSDLRVLEVTTLGQFNEILQYMKAFFDYIDEAVCPDPQ